MNNCKGIRCDGLNCNRKCCNDFCWQHKKPVFAVKQQKSPIKMVQKSPIKTVNKSPVKMNNKKLVSPIKMVNKSPIKMNPSKKVVIYTTPTCPYCIRAKELLRNKNIEYKEVDLSNNPSLRKQLIEKTGQKTVPQIFINDKFIGGYTELSKLKL